MDKPPRVKLGQHLIAYVVEDGDETRVELRDINNVVTGVVVLNDIRSTQQFVDAIYKSKIGILP